MLKYFIEFLGTFIFLSVILLKGEAIPIAIALASMILFGGAISGGHFNPAVSFMMMLKGVISSSDAMLYAVAQLLGGAGALWLLRYGKF